MPEPAPQVHEAGRCGVSTKETIAQVGVHIRRLDYILCTTEQRQYRRSNIYCYHPSRSRPGSSHEGKTRRPDNQSHTNRARNPRYQPQPSGIPTTVQFPDNQPNNTNHPQQSNPGLQSPLTTHPLQIPHFTSLHSISYPPPRLSPAGPRSQSRFRVALI